MSLRILWCYNDPGMIVPFVTALERAKCLVKVVRSAAQAEESLDRGEFDLLIIDVMIPTLDEAEEVVYTPEATDRGAHTGLAFIKLHHAMLKSKGVVPFVFTVRQDKRIRQDFLAAGLAPKQFATKMELCDEELFISRLSDITGRQLESPIVPD